MDFFDKLGKKATEAYKITADKTGKIAKETKLKFKMSELKSKIEDIYEEIGKEVYEKHLKKEEISISQNLGEKCKKIDEISNEIEYLLQQCLELKDKKQCKKCYTQIEKDMKFCPECGAKQEENEEKEENEEVKEVEIVENKSSSEKLCYDEVEYREVKENNKQENNKEGNNKEKTNLEKTTEVEINPDAQDITEEEIKKIGE